MYSSVWVTCQLGLPLCEGRRFSATALGNAGKRVRLSAFFTRRVLDVADCQPESSVEDAALEGVTGDCCSVIWGVRFTMIGSSSVAAANGFFFSNIAL